MEMVQTLGTVLVGTGSGLWEQSLGTWGDQKGGRTLLVSTFKRLMKSFGTCTTTQACTAAYHRQCAAVELDMRYLFHLCISATVTLICNYTGEMESSCMFPTDLLTLSNGGDCGAQLAAGTRCIQM